MDPDAAADVLDRLARTATRLLEVPVALVSLVDTDRQWFAGLAGLAGPAAEERQTSIALSFCQHVVTSGAPLIVADATVHPLVRDNPAVRELGVRAYAGVPLTMGDGETLGALCAIDHAPHMWKASDLDGLRDLAGAAVAALELRIASHRAMEREARLLDIIGSATDAIVTTDAALRIVLANDAAADVFGYPADSLIGQPLELLIPELMLPRQVDSAPSIAMAEVGAVGGVAAPGAVKRGDLVARRRDGFAFPIEVSVSQCVTKDGPLYTVILRDVTARRTMDEERGRSADALRASEQRYALAARATEHMIWDRDLRTHQVAWSEGGPEVFGYASGAAGVTITWWEEAVHPEDRDRVLDGIRAAVQEANGTSAWRDEYRFQRGDGSFALVQDRGSILRDASGRVVRMIGAMQDITPQRELEAQLRQAQKIEAVGQLAGGVAHDFNNLLTVIHGNLELLLSDLTRDLPPEHSAFEDLEQIAGAAARARTLVRQLLTFSRKLPVRPQGVAVGRALRGAESLLRRVIGEEIQLDVHVTAAAEHALVLIDPGHLDQVLMNLAVNGRDAMLTAMHGHTGVGGTLEIEVATVTLSPTDVRWWDGATPGQWLQLRVTDTGHGMDAATQARAFEPFYTTKAVGAGTGLGLSTVFGIVRQAGGDVRVDSVPGRGTTFTILLPTQDVDDAAGGGADPETHGTDSRQGPRSTGAGDFGSVLLVEDEAPVRTIARRLLERQGYTVLAARHGADALQLWQAHARDIAAVVTDLRMPEMGGRELIARLLPLRPDLPVVFMSGYSDAEAPSTDRPNSVFLEKPFTSETLVSAIRCAIESASVRE